MRVRKRERCVLIHIIRHCSDAEYVAVLKDDALEIRCVLY